MRQPRPERVGPGVPTAPVEAFGRCRWPSGRPAPAGRPFPALPLPRVVGVVHVCFVCSGNICRSPIAGLVLEERLRRAGLADQVRVSSAGTGSWHVGEPAQPHARAVLARAGYPTAHSARQIGGEQWDADLLVALDSGHQRALLRRVPPERVRLLRSFDPSADGPDVPDPYGGPVEDFEEVLAMVEAAVPGLLDWIRERT